MTEMSLLSFRGDPNGQTALLGDIQVGRINPRAWHPRKKASWISYLPSEGGIRMTAPLPVKDVETAMRDLSLEIASWVEAAGLAPVTRNSNSENGCANG